MDREYALVVLAAGIGSRFGGVKQLRPVGPAGEIIMDYSIFDALEAGFNKIVFLIRRDIEADFRQIIGDRVEAVCARRGVQVVYAFQERDELPGGFRCPPERTKPWGTGQAMLCCKGLLNGPFVVLNADDYYGRDVFPMLLRWLKALPENAGGQYCLAGFRLGNTLSAVGGVTRGVCQVNEGGLLTGITETRGIVTTERGPVVGERMLDVNACVSMNMWGFTPDVMDTLEQRFVRFLEEHRLEPKSEFLLPEIVDELLKEGLATVQVLPTEESWLGMTYQEDVAPVAEAFHCMVKQGIYKAGLYGNDE